MERHLLWSEENYLLLDMLKSKQVKLKEIIDSNGQVIGLHDRVYPVDSLAERVVLLYIYI